MTAPEHVDVLVVGAGLSGIGAACRLSVEHPHRTVAVLEARDVSGGTWDVFRYPGIRSDSDMFTFGYRWRPWVADRALADGPSILDYLRTVAREYGVDRLIRYRHRVTAASWDSETARWTVEVDRDGEQRAAHRVVPVGLQRLLRHRAGLRARVRPGRTTSPARWCIPSTGPRTSTTPASRSSSSAAAPPR